MEVSKLRSGRLRKKNYPFNAAWTSECSWRATVAPAGWTSSGLRAPPHRWMGRGARWHLSWPLADTTAQKKTTFLDSCMSSCACPCYSSLYHSSELCSSSLRRGLVSSARADVEIFLRTVGEGVNKLARAQANVPSRFQSRVQHANSIRLPHTVVHRRSSTIS